MPRSNTGSGGRSVEGTVEWSLEGSVEGSMRGSAVVLSVDVGAVMGAAPFLQTLSAAEVL